MTDKVHLYTYVNWEEEVSRLIDSEASGCGSYIRHDIMELVNPSEFKKISNMMYRNSRDFFDISYTLAMIDVIEAMIGYDLDADDIMEHELWEKIVDGGKLEVIQILTEREKVEVDGKQ